MIKKLKSLGINLHAGSNKSSNRGIKVVINGNIIVKGQ